MENPIDKQSEDNIKEPDGEHPVKPASMAGKKGVEQPVKLLSMAEKEGVEEPVECPYPGCTLKFSRQSRFTIHYRIHTGERPFVCTSCDMTYTRNAHLQRHIKINHSNNNKPEESFACDQCDRKFSLKPNLTRHMRRKHENRFKCDICDAVFNKNRQLIMHKAVHEGGTEEGTWKCTQCNKVFPYKYQLKRHRRIHDGYKCDDCEVVLAKWSDIVMHRKNHTKSIADETNGELVSCDKCERKFISRYLKMHRQIHDEVRPVVHCPEAQCPRYFYFQRNLNQHISSFHRGNRFHCTIKGCDQSLSSKQKMEQHIALIHSDTPQKKKERKKPKGRKDKGVFKKPMAAVITRMDLVNQEQLLQHSVKLPLDDINTIRKEGREFVGSSIETSDSEGFVGCIRGKKKRKQKTSKSTCNGLTSVLEDIEDIELEERVAGLLEDVELPQGEDTEDNSSDTDRETEHKPAAKPNFALFVKNVV